MHVAERAGSNAAAAQEESARLPGAAEGDGPNVSGGSFCPEFGATRRGAAASGGGREAEGQPPALPRQSPRQGTMPDGSRLLFSLSRYLFYGTSKFTAVSQKTVTGSYIEQTQFNMHHILPKSSLILSSRVFLYLAADHLPRGFPIRILKAFLTSPCVLHVPRIFLID